MTEPSEAAKAKACELANSARVSSSSSGPYITADCFNSPSMIAFATFIQQVSDAAKGYFCNGMGSVSIPDAFAPFILPEPVDPLVDALRASVADPEQFAAKLRVNLSKRGLKIVEASHDG